MKRVIIVGGVAAGMSAAARLKRRVADVDITVFEKGRHVSYGACGLPYFLAGDIREISHLIARTEEEFIEDGINLLTGREEIEVLPDSGKVRVRHLADDCEEEYEYDRLVLATGAEAVMLPVEGKNLLGVRTLRTLEDGLEIEKLLNDSSCRKVTVAGGGYIGVEIAECLRRRKKEVTVVEMEETILTNFGREMSQLALSRLRDGGVKVRTGERVRAFKGREKVEEVLTDRGSHEADLVIVAVGVRPRSQLAEAAGIETGVKGAVKVDRCLETSREGIFAAGDCAETYHQILRSNSYLPLGTVANKQGRLLGDNLFSDNRKKYAGTAGTSITRVFDLGLARTGLSREEAVQEGYSVDTVFIKAGDRAGYMPNAEPMYVSLVYTRDEGRILGAQLAGEGEAAKRIDAAVTAINQGMTLAELSRLDFAYSPPFAPVWDAFLIAARIAQR